MARRCPRMRKRGLAPRTDVGVLARSGDRPDSSRGSAAGQQEIDPLTTYMRESNDMLTEMISGFAAVYKDLRAIRTVAIGMPAASDAHATFIHKIDKLDGDMWGSLEEAKRLKSRFQMQYKKVAARTKKQTREGLLSNSSRPKSKARQTAGKKKAATLKEWHALFTEGRTALESECYKGSLKLKKGMPLYKKIQDLK